MPKKPNPFNPNSVVTPSLFAGRASQVLQILGKLEQVKEGMPASFVLQGDRGIGKTALAKLIMHVAEAKDPDLGNLKFLTSYYSVEKDQTFDSVLQASLNLMTDKMPPAMLSQLGQRLGDFFKNGKFSIGSFSYEGPGGGKESEEKFQAVKDRVISALSNTINSLTDASLEGILVVLDEIHNLKDPGGAAQILRAISTTLDVSGRGKISFMVIGYPEGIETFFEGDPSAKRHFDVFPLNVMPREEAKQILTKGFDKVGLKYDTKALDDYIDTAGGYPHSIQVIGHHLVDIDTDGSIDHDDWINALNRAALELQSKDFSEMYDFRGKATLREFVLNVLALEGNPLPKQTLREKVGGKNIYSDTYLGALKRSGAVKEDRNGLISLHSMLFRAAIYFHLAVRHETDETVKALWLQYHPAGTAQQPLKKS